MSCSIHSGLQPINVPTMVASGLPTVTSNAVISHGLANTSSDTSYEGGLLGKRGSRHRSSGNKSGNGTGASQLSAGHLMNEKNKNVTSQVKEALGYLKARQEFWMQQKPMQAKTRPSAASKC